MNPLSQQEKNQIKSFTPVQREEYNRYRASGFDAQAALRITLAEGESTTASRPSPIREAISQIPQDIASGYRNVARDFNEQGFETAVRNAPVRLVGGLGRAVGTGFGGVLGQADESLTGGRVGDALGGVIEGAVNTPLGQDLVRGATAINQATDGIAGDVLDAFNIAGVGALASQPANQLRRQIINSARRTGTQAVEGVSRGSRSLREIVGSKTPEAISSLIPGQRAASVAERAASAGMQNVDDTVLRTAVNRGFDEADAVFLSSLSDADKVVGRQLFDLAEKATTDKRALYGSRPIDVVGSNLTKPINELKAKQREFGKEVETAAKALQGQKVEGLRIQDRIQSTLDEAGITGGPGFWDFAGSRYEFVPEVQKRIADTLDQIILGLESGDAFRVHNLKKAIDEAVNYAKTQEGLTGSAQTLIKDFRRAIDDELDASFPAYNEANSKFSDLQDFIDDTESLFGKDRALTDARAANRLRRIFSNAETREDVKNYISRLDEYAGKYGVEKPGNLYDQVLITEILERMYGTQAITSLQGEVQKALKGVQAVSEIVRDPIRGAGRALGGTIDIVAGQTDEARKQFLRNLFNQ